MANLYLITGPAGVGKSTLSKALAESKCKSALIEGDEIYHQVIGSYIPAWKDGNHLDIFWKICLDNINTYLSNGYDVIFNYIINPKTLDILKENFKNYSVKFIVLIVDKDILIQRDKQRPLDYQMNERCLVLLEKFKNMNFNKNYFLDTTNLSVEEIINIIEKDNKFLL